MSSVLGDSLLTLALAERDALLARDIPELEEKCAKLEAERDNARQRLYSSQEALTSALNAIQFSRKGSIGSIDSHHICQINVESAKGWRETLRRCEEAGGE